MRKEEGRKRHREEGGEGVRGKGRKEEKGWMVRREEGKEGGGWE